MSTKRKLAFWGVCVLAAFVIFASFYQPGTKFADRATHIQVGMTIEEAEQVMGCPPGDYQTRMGDQIFYSRSISIRPGGGSIPVCRSWIGEDGEVCVWMTFQTGTPGHSPITKVEWTPHNRGPRSLARMLWEEAAAYASPIAKAWDDTCAFFVCLVQ